MKNADTNRQDAATTSTTDEALRLADLIDTDSIPLGIDKLELFARPTDVYTKSWEWDDINLVHRETSGHRYRANLIGPDDHDAIVRVDHYDPEVPCDMYMAFNPSQERPLVGVNGALAVAKDLWKLTETLVIHSHPLQGCRIHRIDIAADFVHAGDTAAILNVLKAAQPRRAWTKQITDGRGRRGGTTVRHMTSNAGEMVAYDKGAQAKLLTPTLRLEARIFKKARARYGLVYVHQIDEDSIRKAFNDMAAPFVDALRSSPTTFAAPLTGVRPRRFHEALGALAAKEHGLDSIYPVDRRRDREHAAILRGHGITTLDQLSGPSSP